jgi:hypothetical protein
MPTIDVVDGFVVRVNRQSCKMLDCVEKMARVKGVPTDEEIALARLRGRAEMAAGAATATYDRRRDAIVLTMRSGAIATIPRSLIPVVCEAEARAAADLELSPMGNSLRFPSLDADFAVQGLIRHAFGVNEANRIAGAHVRKPVETIYDRR